MGRHILLKRLYQVLASISFHQKENIFENVQPPQRNKPFRFLSFSLYNYMFQYVVFPRSHIASYFFRGAPRTLTTSKVDFLCHQLTIGGRELMSQRALSYMLWLIQIRLRYCYDNLLGLNIQQTLEHTKIQLQQIVATTIYKILETNSSF